MISKLRTNKLAKWALLIIAGTTLVLQIGRTVNPAVLGIDDFIEYWSAAQLNLAGQNPYSPEQIWTIEKAQGWGGEDIPLMMWNPPWALTFILPFGAFSYFPGRLGWLILNLGLVLLSVSVIWEIYAGTRESLWISWVVTFLFFPTLVVLRMGQIGPLILVGLAGFLYFEKRRRWVLAGAATVLIAIKPHLLHLFWFTLAFWVLKERRWGIVVGGLLGALVATGIPLLFSPEVVQQYLQLTSNQTPLFYISTTIGALLRLIAGPEMKWLQFLPSFLGVIWVFFYWRKNRQCWDWTGQIPILILVSMLTTSYGWMSDQVVLLPAVIRSATWLIENRDRIKVKVFVGIFLLINSIALLCNLTSWNEIKYTWFPSALLLAHLDLRRRVMKLPVFQPVHSAWTD